LQKNTAPTSADLLHCIDAMIMHRDFKKSRKAEKAAALLALFMDQEKAGSGPCLLPEEMAVLIEAQCDKKQLALFLRHLSGCEKCYAEWLSLAHRADRKKAADGVQRLAGMKKYSYIGSALAVAASVAVFLNISRPPEFFTDKSAKEATLVLPEQEQAAAPALSKKDRVEDEEENSQALPAASAPSNAPPGKNLQEQDFVGDVAGKTARRMKSLPAPVLQSESQIKKQSMPPATVAGGALVQDVDSWLERLRRNCLEGRQESAFWTRMQLEGRELIDNNGATLSAEKKEKISAALALLSEMGKIPVRDQCRQILALLAEEQENR